MEVCLDKTLRPTLQDQFETRTRRFKIGKGGGEARRQHLACRSAERLFVTRRQRGQPPR
ncbi:hypothetical protein MesoLjLb_23730 [Mesorhizobium sp. L-8-3]|nr:hypothetical protein MesoLjLb_23730 [Mesorhizobium sp. L-8-3]